jgi:hypothetical protein
MGCPTPAEAGTHTHTVELADVVRRHGDAYRRCHRLRPVQHRALDAIACCRSAALGGHLERCDQCGRERPVYNSCRNRHCPKCQSLAKARWLEARQAELLPVGYFHVVFTLPHGLNGLLAYNPRRLYHQLFASAAASLQAFAATERGATLGVLAILHTWDQQLRYHVHLHCVVPAGGLSLDGQRWVATPRPDFLFAITPLAAKFRGHFLAHLKTTATQGMLQLPASLAPAGALQQCLDTLYAKRWVVYIKPPFAGPARVLDYLGRYTHRVAISNERIVGVDAESVRFRYRDRADGDRTKIATLPAQTFLGRFLQHVLPPGFVRIRRFGFLANRVKGQGLARCRELLDAAPVEPPEPKPPRQWLIALTGVDPCRCRHCGGTLVRVERLPPARAPPGRGT